MDNEIDIVQLFKFIKRKKLSSIIIFIISLCISLVTLVLSMKVTNFISIYFLKVVGIAILIAFLLSLIIISMIITYFDYTIKNEDYFNEAELLENIKNDEDIRKVKTKIRLVDKGKVIFITSPKNGENILIINSLVREFAKDTKIIFINADFRSRGSEKEGYSNILKKYPNSLKKYITKKEDADYIDIGTELEEPEVLLYSENNKKLIANLKKHYDYIIFYNINSIDYSDSLILSKMSDQNYIVVKLYETNKSDLAKCTNALRQINARLDGVICISENIKECL